MIFEHKSVLLMETVDSLNVKPDGIYVDGTLGGGGHAYEVSRRLGEKGRLIGIDQDADAIAAATERLLPFKDKVTIVRSNYKNNREVLFNLGIEKVDGIYLDLGVSSYQLDTADRGFSYREDAPLDMRMDQRNDKTAADIIHGLNESVASKTCALVKRVGGEGAYMMTGGVSKNKGVVDAIERRLGVKLCISDEAQLNGALGAALFAKEL